jgi:hypothetical protein
MRRRELLGMILTTLGVRLPLRSEGVAYFPDAACFSSIREGDLITISGVPGVFRATRPWSEE